MAGFVLIRNDGNAIPLKFWWSIFTIYPYPQKVIR